MLSRFILLAVIQLSLLSTKAAPVESQSLQAAIDFFETPAIAASIGLRANETVSLITRVMERHGVHDLVGFSKLFKDSSASREVHVNGITRCVIF
jgi:hypothetical protein